MADHDLRDFDADLDRNRPWYRDDSDMVSGAAIFSMVVAGVLAVGALFYVVSDQAKYTAGTSPMSTMGQGDAQTIPKPRLPEASP